MSYGVILTTAGAAKIAAGNVNITEMAIGDSGGTEYEPDGSEVALLNEVYRGNVSAYSVSENKIFMQLTIPRNTGGFYIREAGAFDEDGVLIFIANIPPRLKTTIAEGATSDLTINMVATLSNDADVSITIDGSSYVTVGYLDNKTADNEETSAATSATKLTTPAGVYAGYGINDPVTKSTNSTLTVDDHIVLVDTPGVQITLPDIADYPKSRLNKLLLKLIDISGEKWSAVTSGFTPAATVNLSITGGSTTPPTYALNSSNLTVTNATIASNVATAIADGATAQTVDYVATGNVSNIIAKMQYKPLVLPIASGSSTGSIKVNYSENNTLQVGSKILVTKNGATTEETIAAGSQTGSSTVSMPNGISTVTTEASRILSNEDGSLLVALYVTGSGATSAVVSKRSVDGGVTWSSAITILSADSVTYSGQNLGGACFGNGIFVFCVKTYNGNYGYTFITTNDGNAFNTNEISRWEDNQRHLSNILWDGTHFICLLSGTTVWGNTTQPSRLISTNGLSWSSTLITGYPVDSGVPKFFAYDGSGTYLCYLPRLSATSGTTNMIFKSTDNCLTWSSLTTSFTYNQGSFITLGASGVIVNGCTHFKGNWYGVIDFYGGANNVWRSADLENFEILTTPNISQVTFFIATNDVLYRGQSNTTTIIDKLLGNAFSAFSALNSMSTSGQNGTISVNNTIYNTISKITPGYQFTITSPALPVPDAVYLGGQSLQYYVGTGSTPTWTNATVSYSDAAGLITATANIAATTGTHVQLKATLKKGDILSQIGATLTIAGAGSGGTEYRMTPYAQLTLRPTADGWLIDSDTRISINTKSTNYTLLVDDDIIIAGADNITLTLADATKVQPGKVRRIKSQSHNNITINAKSGQSINGASSLILNAGDSLVYYSDSSNWIRD